MNTQANRNSRPRRTSRPSAADAARLQAVAEWRRAHLEAQERALLSNTQSSGDLVAAVVGALNLDKKAAEIEIVNVWSHVLDPSIVKHARPVGLHKGTLFVDVDSNVWLSEIVRYRRHEILKRLQGCFGPKKIQRISFRVAG